MSDTIAAETVTLTSNVPGHEGEEITEHFTTEIRPAGPIADDQDEEAPVWRRLPDDVPAVELRLPGEVVNPPKVCQHRAEDVMVQTLVAAVTCEEDGTGNPVRWQIRVKAICQCGIAFALDREGTAPRDGSSGTVLAMHPITGD